MQTMIERVAKAIEDADVKYSMELIRLVDGVSTYLLRYDDGEVLEFGDTDDAYDHVSNKRRKKAARAAIEEMRLPTKGMIDAAYAAHSAYEDAPEPKAWCGLHSAFEAMVDAALADEGDQA